MNPLYYGDQPSRNFYEGVEKLTDRELQERQAFYLMKIEQSNERIKLNMQFWFYATIASIVIAVFVLANE